MAVYTIHDLKNLITERVKDNHIRAIDGEELQELLHDILDSLESYTDDAVVEPAINYYVDDINWDPLIGALTLLRAGGILPVDISVDLDGRYLLIADTPRSDEVTVDPGEQDVEFIEPFGEDITGDDYTVPVIKAKGTDGFFFDLEPYDKTRFGFKVNADQEATFCYTATPKR